MAHRVKRSGNTDPVAGAVGEDPALWSAGVVYDAAACGDRRCHARLGMLAGDGDVDVHRVPERLVRAEFLHPHGRSVAERSGTAPCVRAVAETARARAMCRSSSRRTPRVEPHAETIVRHREQRHPVVDALRAEERVPTLLAHLPRLETQLLRSPTERMSRPVRRELTHTGYLQQRWPAGR